MKFNKLALAAVVSAVLATSASADQTFHLYGSTAYRKATFASLNGLYTDGTVQIDSGGFSVATVSLPIASPTDTQAGSTNMIWKGHMPSVDPGIVTIFCNWAGSVGGIRSIADPSFGNVQFYLKDGGPYNVSNYTSGKVDLAMSDCDQLSTRFDPSVSSTYQALNETRVCVLEFIWAKGNGSPASFTDVGPYTLSAICQLGTVPLSQFTGVVSDKTNQVYLTGRDDDSGTRILALADSMTGTSTILTQYACPDTNGVYNIVPFGPGDGFGAGYSSGGSVKTALITTRPSSYTAVDGFQDYLMGYIGITDAVKVNGLSATPGSNTIATVTMPNVPTSQWLNYNGVPWSEGAIEEGAYTYFGYEHLDISSSPTAAVSTLATALAAKQELQAGSGEVPGTMPISVMDIGLRSDGSVPGHN